MILMTLLDAVPDRPPETPLWRRMPMILVTGVLLLAITIYHLRNFWEERTVSRFLTTVEAGDFEKAYQLWQPSESYTYRDFLRDWGERGDYGKIRSFSVLDSDSKGFDGVVVRVRINNVNPPLKLWVSRKTKALAFSPF